LVARYSIAPDQASLPYPTQEAPANPAAVAGAETAAAGEYGMTVMSAIEIKRRRLVRGVKLSPANPEVAKSFEAECKSHYETMR